MRRSQLHHHTHWWRNLFITIIVIGVLGYGGYRLFYYSEGINRPQQTAVASSAKTSTSQKASSQAKTSSTQSKLTSDTWNDTKDKRLATFIKSWSQTMNQEYVAATPTNNANYYGIQIPNGLSKVTTLVSNQKANLHWSTTGTGSQTGDNYQVVAAYTSVATQAMNKILYSFTFHENKPVVLVTETTNGTVLYFRPTANQDLASGFKEITEGKTPTVKATTTTSSVTSATNSATTTTSPATTTNETTIGNTYTNNTQNQYNNYYSKTYTTPTTGTQTQAVG